MIRLNLWFLPRAFFTARGPWVAASTRHSLRPLSFRRATFLQSSGATRRENADAHLVRFMKMESINPSVVPAKQAV
jgi:hypothetical protein